MNCYNCKLINKKKKNILIWKIQLLLKIVYKTKIILSLLIIEKFPNFKNIYILKHQIIFFKKLVLTFILDKRYLFIDIF